MNKLIAGGRITIRVIAWIIGTIVFLSPLLLLAWRHYTFTKGKFFSQAPKLDEIQAYGTFIAGIAGIVLIWATLRRARAMEAQAVNSEKQIAVAEQGQITERYTRAIDQLGAWDEKQGPKLEIRVGGIYALGRIAHDSERDHWTVMETLMAYLREHCRIENIQNEKDDAEENEESEPSNDRDMPPRVDIKAILDVLILRRHIKAELAPLDLSGLYLCRAVLPEVCLIQADFHGAELKRADFRGAQLERANFPCARLERADFRGARLEGAFFARAELEGAHFREARLDGAIFVGAELKRADFREAHLTGANFEGAELKRADFRGAHLAGADFEGVNLEGADFQGANLRGVVFSRAILQGADFRDTCLEEAAFEGANLEGAFFDTAGV